MPAEGDCPVHLQGLGISASWEVWYSGKKALSFLPTISQTNWINVLTHTLNSCVITGGYFNSLNPISSSLEEDNKCLLYRNGWDELKRNLQYLAQGGGQVNHSYYLSNEGLNDFCGSFKLLDLSHFLDHCKWFKNFEYVHMHYNYIAHIYSSL